MKNCIILISCFLFAACGSSPPPKPEPVPAVNAREAHELALESFHAGRYREAIGGFQRAGQLFLSVDDPHGVAVAAVSEAEVQLLLGESDAARETLHRAQDAIARNEELHERARLLEARLRIDSEPAMARRRLQELTDAAPDIATQARMLLCELAISNGETACVTNLTAGDALTSARVEQLHARAALVDGDAATATEHLDRALNIYRVLAYRPGIAAAHEWNATAAAQAGDHRAAIEHLERALYLRLWIRDRTHAVDDLARLAELADGDEARQRYSRWHSTLLDDEGPEWEALIQEIFSSR